MDAPNATPVPPPPPEYYVMKDGNILGPFSIEELREAVTDERIALSDFVQTGGLEMWRPVSRVLGVDGSMATGAVAPDWRSIITWAWLRLRYNLDEQSLITGVTCLAIGLIALLLARFSFVFWLPWFALAATAAVAMLRRRQAVSGLLLLVAICLLPIAVAKYPFRSSRVASDGMPGRQYSESAAVDATPRIRPDAEKSSNSASPPQFASVEPASPVPAASPPFASNENPREVAVSQPAVVEPPAPPQAPIAPMAPVAEAKPAATPAQPARTGIFSLFAKKEAPPATLPAVTPPQPPVTASAPSTTVPAAGGGDLVQRYRDSLVVMRGGDSAGSGFLCKKGERVWLFTNNHVAAGMKQPTFSRLDGSRITVGIPESAAGYDAIRFALSESPAQPLESVADLQGIARIDDEVLVLGNSGGGGVVTSIKGKLLGIGPDRIEVSAEFIPGNSGSPIIHVPSGKVIGIATYLTRRYEEFSSGLVTRRFGFRIDNVPRWEPVNWQAFQSEAEQLRQISALTEDIFDFLGTLRQKQSPSFATETLRRPGQQWLETIGKPRLSEADKLNATHSFLNSLRYMVRADVTAAEARLRYTFFRDRLKEERAVRDKLYQAFDSETRRLASPSSR